MRISWNRGGFILLCGWFLAFNGAAQKLVWKDSIVISKLVVPADSTVSTVRFRLLHDLEYAFSCNTLFFLNWQQGDHTNLIAILHHLKYRSHFTNDKNFKICNSFIHDLGIQYFPDSISCFQPDENALDTQVDFRVGKNISCTLFSNITTRLFNSYRYGTDQAGNMLKILSASFLTPLLWTFSTGFGWTWPLFGTLSLGLSAGKFTWIRSKEIYDHLGTGEFYGVPKSKGYAFEYGLSIHVLVDKDFLKRVHWNCDVLIFKNYEKPVDLVMKNVIGIRINKFIKTSIQTRLFYEKEVSKNIQVENLVTVGFCFNL